MSAAAAGTALLLAAVGGAVGAGDLRAAPLLDAALLVLALAGYALVASARGGRPLLILLGLVLVRVVAFAGGPTLSDDQYRYVHEGRAERIDLALSYRTTPKDLHPAPPPDDGISALVNHPDVPAAYPPGVELVLAATAWLGDAVSHPFLPLRLLVAAADGLVLALLYRKRAQAPRAYVLYGAHPLPILELTLGGHLDGLAIAAIVAATLLARPILRGALVGLAMHVKPIAVVALVALPRGQRLVAALGCALVVLALALPHAIAGAPITRGLVEYGTRWRAAPFAYAALEAPLLPLFADRAARGVYAHVHVTGSPIGVLIEQSGTPILALGDARLAERPILLDAGFFARALAGLLLLAALAFIARMRAASHEARVGLAL
ncbi:MAG TPA: hypothetical protein VGO62_14145, partial [Myxococcota bacterium]